MQAGLTIESPTPSTITPVRSKSREGLITVHDKDTDDRFHVWIDSSQLVSLKNINEVFNCVRVPL